MRLFIAIRLNEDMKAALIDAQNQLYEGGVRGNFSPEENLHLTMAFIGEYPDAEEVLDAMETVEFSAFDLTLDGLGSFGDIWWAGLGASPALQAVARRIRRALSDMQIPFDRKNFRPHITLLRKAKMQHGMPSVTMHKAGMSVEKISLMRSDRGKNGMIYTEIGAIESEKRRQAQRDPEQDGRTEGRFRGNH